MFVSRARLVLVLTLLFVTAFAARGAITCPALSQHDLTKPVTVTAEIAALDQPFMLNRYGAAMPQGMIYALTSDLVSTDGSYPLTKGKVRLRDAKRPRPVVLRVRQGDCLQVTLWNYIGTPNPDNGVLQPQTTNVSFHVNGMQVVNSIKDDGSLVGNTSPSGNGIIAPGSFITYTLYAQEIGTFLAYSTASMAGGCGQCLGQITTGLFGAVTVEPTGAEFYRSQVTAADMAYAVTPAPPPQNQLFNYTARYPVNYTPPAGAKAPQPCWPVLQMVAEQQAVQNGQCVANPSGPLVTYYSDLTAIITGPKQGNFTGTGPEFNPVPASPNRRQPFREFTIVYHDVLPAVQAFVDYYLGQSSGTNTATLGAGKDNFAINYGTGGIGSEILANRLNVGANAGPPGSTESSCVECKFEEFFLASWAVGDPAMVVDRPANQPAGAPKDVPNVESARTVALTKCSVSSDPSSPTGPCVAVQNNPPLAGRKATTAFFADDPSNVYHSYLNDHVTFRILHAGGNFTHVHHQHAHQWLHSPNSPNGSYLDSQLISPGATFTLEMVYNGSGNRNKTAGDSIFHCHFYPHFAAGMWSLWRVHDVFESGTALNGSGQPATGARALPDGEIALGTPIPGIVPIPTLPMALMPAPTKIVESCLTTAVPCPPANVVGYKAITTGPGNPGYPFFVPGVGGHRAPRAPLDIACDDPNNAATCNDGGLKRSIILAGSVTNQQQNQWDFSKDNTGHIQPGYVPPGSPYPAGCANGCLFAQQLAEGGEPVELAAISYMGVRNHPSFTPKGASGYFVTNGLPRKAAPYANGALPGSPFADPAVDDNGAPVGQRRIYKAAVVQTDLAFNKQGWHYPQQRFLTLWQDLNGAVSGSSSYTPQPLFFRAHSQTDFVEYWHMNLVPSYYELDDYQVRTPTDILGQHIHLVKFDVLASDGAANGFNYEDGTLSPDEVRDRIQAIRNWNGCSSSAPISFQCPQPKMPDFLKSIKPPQGQNWNGAQVTVQRWYADELTGCNDGAVPNCNQNADRTLRTVFTHDHFGPSTHQQVGLYAGLLVEPTNSVWTDPSTGVQLSTRTKPTGPTTALDDGGPTSWQALITKVAQAPGDYREFALEFQDLAHAYQGASITSPVAYTTYAEGAIGSSQNPWGWVNCPNVINAQSYSISAGPPNNCTASQSNFTPQLIDSSQAIGTMSVNYRNEPLSFRIAQPSSGTGNIFATDLAYAYSSGIARNAVAGFNPNINIQPPQGNCVSGSAKPCGGGFIFPNPLPGAQPTDAYTPILQAYQGDNVQIRVLVGAHFFNHNFDVQGLKWLFEPSNGNSGYRDNQAMGISEHFEFLFKVPSTPRPTGSTPGNVLPFTDYLYKPGAGQNDQLAGNWGMLRAYSTGGNAQNVMNGTNYAVKLLALPNNASGGTAFPNGNMCTPNRTYYVAAISPKQISSTNTNPYTITYYTRSIAGKVPVSITNDTPMLYVPTDASGAIPNPLPCVSGSKVPCAPIVLRANAGECVSVVLFNRFDTTNSVFTDADGNYGGWPTSSSNSPLYPSTRVGMHAQLASANAASDNGVNVGFNMQQYRDTTVGPTGSGANCVGVSGGPPCIKYTWYAGNVNVSQSGAYGLTAGEFGSANLFAADPLEQPPHALVGALVIEPPGSVWCTTSGTRVCNSSFVAVTDTTVDVFKNTPSGLPVFREFVGMLQDNVYLSNGNFNAMNFGTEPFASRYKFYPPSCNSDYNNCDMTKTFSNFLPSFPGSSTTAGDPQTPIFTAQAGRPVRFRMLHPDGLGGFPDNTFTLHGHVWQEEPYLADGAGNPSTVLGNNVLSQWMGSRDGYGAGNHFDILLPSAGGVNARVGDYLYQSFPAQEGQVGIWGVFRVQAATAAPMAMETPTPSEFPPLEPNVTKEAPPKDPGDRFLRPRDKAKKLLDQSGSN